MELLATYMILATALCHLSLDAVSAEKFNCPEINLVNGRARLRSKGKIVNFRCKKKFELVGDTFAVCLDTGKWSLKIPICVGTTCTTPDMPANVIVQELHGGGVLKFTCDAGMTRSGPELITCDGEKWNDEPPKCVAGATLECNFEDSGICGWSHDFDDDFDWTWHKGETPTADTGPIFDHTTNSSEGHYLFMESSAPLKSGHKTRLLSPAYAPENTVDTCFEFFYHMYGPDGDGEVGDLDVYVKPISTPTYSLDQSNNIFHQSGNQGTLWQRGYVKIPQIMNSFQIVIQATRLKSWSSDIAIDDVKLEKCKTETTTSASSTSNKAVTDSEDDVDENHSEPTVRKITTLTKVSTMKVADSTTFLTKLPTKEISFTNTPAATSTLSTTTKSTVATTTSTTVSTTTPRRTTAIIITTPRITTTTTTQQQTTTTMAPTFISSIPTATTAVTTSTTTTPSTTATTETTSTTTTDNPTTPTTVATTITSTTSTPLGDTTTEEKDSTEDPDSDSDVDDEQWSTTSNDLTTTLAPAAQTDSGYTDDHNEIDKSTVDNYDYDNDNRNRQDEDDDNDDSDDENNDNSDEDSRSTLSPGRIDPTDQDSRSTSSPDRTDPTDVNTISSMFNQSSSRTDSMVSVADHNGTSEDYDGSNGDQDNINEDHDDVKENNDNITASSRQETDKAQATNNLRHGEVKNDRSTSSSKHEMLPLIIGVAAAVLVAAAVIGGLAYMWARNQRRKQEKEQEDQMNIITEYVETNLSV